MKPVPILSLGLLLACFTAGSSQNVPPSPKPPAETSKDSVPKPKTTPEQKTEETGNDSKYWLLRHAKVTGGQITLPFKIRPGQENGTFKLTTDVTLGGFVGYTRRLSANRNYYLTVPLTAGLTFINLSDDNTTFSQNKVLDDTEVVPGLSWSTGVILQFERYNVGIMIGKDYASEVGNQWAYHRKLWWSFGIGVGFTHNNRDEDEEE